MIDETEAERMPYRCGTCTHPHRAGLPCDTCQCAADEFTVDDGTRAEWADLALADLQASTADDPDPILETADATHIRKGLVMWEARVHQAAAWGEVPPLLAVVTMARGCGAGLAHGLGTLMVFPLMLPDRFWRTYASPSDAINGMVALAHHKPSRFDELRRATGLDPARPVVAWALGATASRHEDGKRADARIVQAVDIDDRHYQVSRLREDDSVESEVEPGRLLRRALARAVREQGEDPDEVLDDGLSTTGAALSRLCRYTTQEAIARGAFSEAGP